MVDYKYYKWDDIQGFFPNMKYHHTAVKPYAKLDTDFKPYRGYYGIGFIKFEKTNDRKKLLCHYYLIYNYKYVYVENYEDSPHVLYFSRKVELEKYVRDFEKAGIKLTLKPISLTPDFWGLD
jgi:hypothetical protein